MATAAREIQVGIEVSGPVKEVTSYRTWLFSGGWPRFDGWPAKNVHTDLESAKSCGLPTRAASGAMLQAYLSELMLDLFGEGWLSHGEMALKFIRIVATGDRIVARGRVQAKRQEGSRCRVEMELWCANQRGEQVVVGTGAGWVA